MSGYLFSYDRPPFPRIFKIISTKYTQHNQSGNTTCQTPNYQILLIYDIYNLNISRFQPLDMLVLIADIQTCVSGAPIHDRAPSKRKLRLNVLPRLKTTPNV